MPQPTDVKFGDQPLAQRVSDELATGVIHGLIEDAKDKEIVLTLKNIEGRPFEVVTEPSGRLLWGVGGGPSAKR
jgi:hypothetical protein